MFFKSNEKLHITFVEFTDINVIFFNCQSRSSAWNQIMQIIFAGSHICTNSKDPVTKFNYNSVGDA